MVHSLPHLTRHRRFPRRNLLRLPDLRRSLLLVTPALETPLRSHRKLDYRLARVGRQLDRHALHQLFVRSPHLKRHQPMERGLCRDGLANGFMLLGSDASLYSYQHLGE